MARDARRMINSQLPGARRALADQPPARPVYTLPAPAPIFCGEVRHAIKSTRREDCFHASRLEGGGRHGAVLEYTTDAALRPPGDSFMIAPWSSEAPGRPTEQSARPACLDIASRCGEMLASNAYLFQENLPVSIATGFSRAHLCHCFNC